VSGIHLLPLGSADRRLVQELISPLEETFHLPVDSVQNDVNVERFYDLSRCQYNSTDILLHLRDNSPRASNAYPVGTSPDTKYLAVLAHDLFIPILTYVFGEAELGGDVAIVSYHRLQNEVYGLAPDPHLLSERLRKEAVHELGHTFGLVHCSLQECVMHTSTYVEDIDLKGSSFCPACRDALARSRAGHDKIHDQSTRHRRETERE
jgi:archaemetzincin